MRSWRVAGLVVTAWVVALALLLPRGPAEAPAPTAPAPVSPSGARDAELAEAAAVLAAWDDRRAAGWRVTDLRSQVLALAVVRATDDRLLLRVVDRVAGGRVVGRDGARASALPGTTATTRVVDLRRGEVGWQVSASRLVDG
ncbi:hypothetical protein [Nocardioides marmoraquaticus]